MTIPTAEEKNALVVKKIIYMCNDFVYGNPDKACSSGNCLAVRLNELLPRNAKKGSSNDICTRSHCHVK